MELPLIAYMATYNSYQVELKEEEMVHHWRDPMEIEGQSFPQSNTEQEDENSSLMYW